MRGHCFTVVRVNEIMKMDAPQAARPIVSVEEPGSVTSILVFRRHPRVTALESALACVLWTSSSLEDLLQEVVFKSGEPSGEMALLDGCFLGRPIAGYGRGGLSCDGERDKGSLGSLRWVVGTRH